MTTIFNTSNNIAGRVARILNFVNSGTEFYVGIGKATPWDSSFGTFVSDINPPSPGDNDSLPEPILYKKVKCVAPATRSLICVDPLGNTSPTFCDIDFNVPANSEVLVQESAIEATYTILDPTTIQLVNGEYNILPELVYIQAEITGADYTQDGWRSSALFTELFLEDGVTAGLDTYLPSQVSGGTIQKLTYNTLVERQSTKTHRFEYIITV